MTKRLICLFITLLCSTQTLFAQRYMGEDPVLMMELKNVEFMGINIAMPMSDILTTLTAQGLNPDCSRGVVCQMQSSDLTLRIHHKGNVKGNRHQQPVDPAVTPVLIGFSQIGGDQSHCHVVEQIIAKYCANSVNKQPCWTDNFGKTTGNISASAKSPDGYRYSTKVDLKKGQFCSLSIKRLN